MMEVFQSSGSTRQSQVRLRELETAANTYRGIYETFLSRFTQSVQQQSFPSTEARVVTVASPPSSPSSPKIGLTLALMGICGLGLGVMSAFAREQMNRQIHTRAELESLLGTSCLAVLPAFAHKRIATRNRGATKDSGHRIPAAQRSRAISATAEALRYIKVAIDLHPAGGKVIGFVSALPGEGKTTVAAGFGAFIARNGGRTLLVDADLRNPSMTRTLGYNDAPGLLDMVADKSSFDDLVHQRLQAQIRLSAGLDPHQGLEQLGHSELAGDEADAEGRQERLRLCPGRPAAGPPRGRRQGRGASVRCLRAGRRMGSTSTDEILKAVAASPILSERPVGAVLNKADEDVMRRFEGYSDRAGYNYYTDEKIPAEVV